MVSPKDFLGKKRNPDLHHVAYTAPARVASSPPPEKIQRNCSYCDDVVLVENTQLDVACYCSSRCRNKAKMERKAVRALQGEEVNGDAEYVRPSTLMNVYVMGCSHCGQTFMSSSVLINVCSLRCASKGHFEATTSRVSYYVLFEAVVPKFIWLEIDEYTQTVDYALKEIYISIAYNITSTRSFKERVTTVDLRSVKERQPQEHIFDFRCPTPHKKVYRTLTEAEDFIDVAHPRDRFILPYVCRCSAIHIGHTYDPFKR